MSNTTDAGTDTGAENDITVDSALTEAFAEVRASQDANTEGQPARDGAAADASNPISSETPAAGAEQANATPDHWSNEEQAAFDALPPETKSLVEKRIAAIEADYTKKTEGSAEAIKLADEVRAVVDPGLQSRLEASGMSIGQGVAYLANLERFASEKPAEYLAFVARHVQGMGVDVAKVLGLGGQPQSEAQPGDDGFTDPTISRLEERLNRYEQSQVEQTRQRVLNDAGQQIAAFRDAKDPSGNPLRPHLADVENDMAALIRANPKMTLEEAYERSTWSNPAVRTKLQEAERAAAAQKARDEAADAQKARRGNIRPGSRNMAPSQAVDSIDDAVSQAFAEINR
ncbi:hypothetical protein [Aureimonas sp. N4]|uniref:hypothetical protein n=1 Tax=Aureimonas sp. N4 TaxID=1638165 RepID=UPI0007853797|nr:hypothetical protein [Aureimonas sp. N4]